MRTDTLQIVFAKWEAQADRMERLDVRVDGAALSREMLRDVDDAVRQHEGEALNLRQAARESGYRADTLGRMLRDDVLQNAGRPNAPRIRRRDLPKKPGHLPPPSPPLKLLGASAGQIARAVVTSDEGDAR